MGLLDDAIREHLDLKRRRGADPTEIERAEREALGPVRRGPDVSGGDAPQAEAAEPLLEPEADLASAPAEDFDPFHEDDVEFHEDVDFHEDDVEFHEPAAATEDHEELPPHNVGEPVERESISEASPYDAEAESLPPHPSEVAPAPEPDLAPHPADPPASAVPPHEDQETEEYELEPEEEEHSDVLESTPEFLQDAPDHDRLWFEQRPPRDFDFDG